MSSGWLSSSRVPNYRLLGLVLGLALLYRLVFWLPSWQPGDALGSYAFSAHKILTGEYAPGAQYTFEWFSGIRLGVVVPAALLVGLIGYSIPLLAVYPLLCSILTLGFVYGIGLRLERQFPHAAILAVACGAVYPLLVTQSPQLLHDTPRTLFATAALFFFVRARERDYDRTNLLLCGLAVGLSYLCAISIFFLLPGVALWIVLQREIRVRQLYIVAGFLPAIMVETVALSTATGELFFRLGALSESVQDVETVWIEYPGISRWIPGYWEAFVSPATPYFILHGLSGWLSVIAVGWSILGRKPLLVLCALCWLADSAILNFGPMPSIETRYLLAGIPMLCVMSGALLSRWLGFRLLSATVGVLLLASSVLGCWLHRMSYAATGDAFRTAGAWLEEYPESLRNGLYVSKKLRPVIGYTSSYRYPVRPLTERVESSVSPSHAMVLYNGYFSRQDLPAWLAPCAEKEHDRVKTGSPKLTEIMGSLRPKIGFESELVLYRLADCLKGT